MHKSPIRVLETPPKRRTGPPLVLMVFLALGLGACASTNLTDTWVDPSVQTLPHFRKVLVAAFHPDSTIRRNAEDALVANIKRAEAVRSYEFTPDWEGGKLDAITDKLKRAGIDGVVTLRLVGVDKEQTWIHPGADYGFGGYWSGSYSMARGPGYGVTDTIVRVETMIYTVDGGKLIYSARSRTFNPTDTAKTVKEIATSVAEDFKKRGLLD